MSRHFILRDETTAPATASAMLAAAKQELGMIPNLARVMANAPAVLAAYDSVWNLFDTTSLGPPERQVVYLTTSFGNECGYCVPWHSLLGRKDGLSAADVEALRTGARLKDSKLEALRTFTRQLILNRGKICEANLKDFFDSGFSREQAL